MDTHPLTNRLAICEAQLTQLRRQQRRILAAAGSTCLLLAAITVTGFTRAGTAAPRGAAAVDTLRVRELVVVDAAGTVRARVGGDLPDAIAADGRRIPRGDKAAGVVLYDAAGLERGGYVTFDRSGHVGLTLDTKQRMVASFVAGPDSGAAPVLEMPDGGLVRLAGGGEAVEVRAERTGGARLNALRAGRVVAQTPTPTTAQATATCAEMRDALLRQARMRADEARKVCGSRLSDATCRACFGTR